MERTFSTDLLAKDGQQVSIAGWLHHQRRLARVTFALIRDAKALPRW